MSSVIWKFSIPGPGAGAIQMPNGARCLHAREQGNVPYIWALVDPNAEQVNRQFLAAETGNFSVPEGSRYLGTCFLDGGAYVLHIFEPEAQTK